MSRKMMGMPKMLGRAEQGMGNSVCRERCVNEADEGKSVDEVIDCKVSTLKKFMLLLPGSKNGEPRFVIRFRAWTTRDPEETESE
jgi:hypothetical protein